jgi:hypothetical protein
MMVESILIKCVDHGVTNVVSVEEAQKASEVCICCGVETVPDAVCCPVCMPGNERWGRD